VRERAILTKEECVYRGRQCVCFLGFVKICFFVGRRRGRRDACKISRFHLSFMPARARETRQNRETASPRPTASRFCCSDGGGVIMVTLIVCSVAKIDILLISYSVWQGHALSVFPFPVRDVSRSWTARDRRFRSREHPRMSYHISRSIYISIILETGPSVKTKPRARESST